MGNTITFTDNKITLSLPNNQSIVIGEYSFNPSSMPIIEIDMENDHFIIKAGKYTFHNLNEKQIENSVLLMLHNHYLKSIDVTLDSFLLTLYASDIAPFLLKTLDSDPKKPLRSIFKHLILLFLKV